MSYSATVANPWVAVPGRIEDEYNGRTVALKVNGSVDLPTNDVGLGMIAFQPNLLQMVRRPGIANGSTDLVTWSSNPGVGVQQAFVPCPDLTALTAAYNAYRIVSMGLKATYVGGEIDAKGEIVIAFHQGVPEAGLAADATKYRENGHVHVQPIYEIKAPVHAAAHNFDRPSFKGLNVGTGNFYDTFPTVTVTTLGGPQPSKSLIKIDYCYNLELIPIPGSLFEHLAKPSPTSMQGISTVRRLTPGRAGPSLAAVTKGAAGSRRLALPSGSKKRRYKSKRKGKKWGGKQALYTVNALRKGYGKRPMRRLPRR